jgi:hypothetical protein
MLACNASSVPDAQQAINTQSVFYADDGWRRHSRRRVSSSTAGDGLRSLTAPD